jgi:hypothetical protein
MHGVPILPSAAAAIGAGTRSVAVEGVIIVSEHGHDALNSRKQRLYPRRRPFEDVVRAFRLLGRRVPVFSHEPLPYDGLFARWTYDLAQHEAIPVMVGSTLPVAWRVHPPLAPPSTAGSDALIRRGFTAWENGLAQDGLTPILPSSVPRSSPWRSPTRRSWAYPSAAGRTTTWRPISTRRKESRSSEGASTICS